MVPQQTGGTNDALDHAQHSDSCSPRTLEQGQAGHRPGNLPETAAFRSFPSSWPAENDTRDIPGANRIDVRYRQAGIDANSGRHPILPFSSELMSEKSLCGAEVSGIIVSLQARSHGHSHLTKVP
jgi:hypothetical protein